MPTNSQNDTPDRVKPKAARGRPPKENGDKLRLDKATVVKMAAELICHEGLAALSLHRLADALGVQTPSLYNHIEGLAGLQRELTLLNARNLKERMANAAMGKAGEAAVLAVMEAYRAYVKECPGLYLAGVRVSGNQPQPSPELVAVENEALAVALAMLDAFNLPRVDAIHAVRGIRSLVHGFATLEVGGGFGYPLDCDASFRWLVTLYVRGLENLSTKTILTQPMG